MVLDEIEKAHPDLFNILLQVMDHATLTDNNGRKADFRNVVLILTTNAGAREMARKSVGFGDGAATTATTPTQAKRRIERTFTPEFRNRLDAGSCSRGLSPRGHPARSSTRRSALLQTQLDEKKVTLELTDGGARLARRARLRPGVRRAADGAPGRRAHQAAARRGAPVRQAGRRAARARVEREGDGLRDVRFERPAGIAA